MKAAVRLEHQLLSIESEHDDKVVLVVAADAQRAREMIEVIHGRGAKAVLARQPVSHLTRTAMARPPPERKLPGPVSRRWKP